MIEEVEHETDTRVHLRNLVVVAVDDQIFQKILLHSSMIVAHSLSLQIPEMPLTTFGGTQVPL